VAVGDLNTDGIPDIVIANQWAAPGFFPLSVLLGNGDGTFQPRVDFVTSGLPDSAHIKDIDQDGSNDIVVVSRSTDSVSIHSGNGDGTLQMPENFPTGSNPSSLTIADFNGDGTLDLAVANAGRQFVLGDSVSILLGSGNGTFGPRQDFPTGPGPSSIVSGDFDGDSVLDLAVTNSGTPSAPANTVSVLIGNGDGTFKMHRDFFVGLRPISISLGDFDDNGTADLAVANLGTLQNPGSTISLLLGDGEGGFSEHQQFATGRSPRSVSVGSLDSNGTLDFVVANADSDSVSILLANAFCLTCPADVTRDGELNFFDVAAFLVAFNNTDPIADFNGDGLFNFFDVSAYLQAFNAGCP
jgi:hypothetical protein